jgi:hypothetical protein
VQSGQSYRQPAQLFWNAGRDTRRCFVPLREGTGDLAKPIVGRGAAKADIDGDGDLDLVLTEIDGPPLLLRNDQETGHHWLRVVANRVGTVVTLSAGGVTQRRLVSPTRSYLSQVEMPVTFGLGDARRIDSLVVTWPDGTEQVIPPPSPDRVIVIR